jgi:hypothetical protein
MIFSRQKCDYEWSSRGDCFGFIRVAGTSTSDKLCAFASRLIIHGAPDADDNGFALRAGVRAQPQYSPLFPAASDAQSE